MLIKETVKVLHSKYLSKVHNLLAYCENKSLLQTWLYPHMHAISEFRKKINNLLYKPTGIVNSLRFSSKSSTASSRRMKIAQQRIKLQVQEEMKAQALEREELTIRQRKKT